MDKTLKIILAILLLNREALANLTNTSKTVLDKKTEGYNAEELLVQILGLQNISSRQSSHSVISFEGQAADYNDDIKQQKYGFVKFENDNFNNDYDNNNINNNHISFIDQPVQEQINYPNLHLQANEDIQDTNQNIPQKPLKRRRKRRRKPKRQNIPGQFQIQNPGFPILSNAYNQGLTNPYNPALPNDYNPGYPNGYNPGGIPNGYNPGLPNPYNPGIPNAYPLGFNGPPQYRPPRRRRPANLAEDALAAVTRALGSVAQYDDFQCVPRLLCEVAGGKGPSAASPTSSLLTTFVDLQPLITLLAAYNGLSSSPLFVFGRAAILGITSKGNTGTCRYAYPQCPTDPDKLVDYLNNHNGGFFRFFNGSPQPQLPSGPQDLQQFYSQLSGGNPNQNQENYGSYPQPGQQQNYGLYRPENNGFNDQRPNGAYGLYNPGFGNNIRDQENYGPQYSYQNNGFGQPNYYKANIADTIDNGIEKRIQNNPNVVYVNTNHGETGLKFPESVIGNGYEKKRETKSLKFPEEKVKTNKYISYDEHLRKGRGFSFPEEHSNRQYVEYYNYPPLMPFNFGNNDSISNDNDYYFDGQMYHVDNSNNNDNEDDGETIYILRGNGDPNNPEVIKLKPGQKFHN